MYVSRNSMDFWEIVPMFFAIMVGILVLLMLAYVFYQNKDKKKELISKKVTVLEKPIQQGNLEWYVMEDENGERMKLRSFQGNSLFISVGDKGIVSYRGETIESFKRE
ncbi:hypothetical protein HMPREF9477_01744 [Lachnospiraceae bacterium 2_1_46FAA]|nr:hypothetical protein HMPREF9477_01744 [Lachnospiraceae bacterium 2_1_46FAA]